MTTSTTLLAFLVILPMLAAIGVLFLVKKKFGRAAGLVVGVATLFGTGWLALNLGMSV